MPAKQRKIAIMGYRSVGKCIIIIVFLINASDVLCYDTVAMDSSMSCRKQ